MCVCVCNMHMHVYVSILYCVYYVYIYVYTHSLQYICNCIVPNKQVSYKAYKLFFKQSPIFIHYSF